MEDVARKFAALKEAESRDWVDEQEPAARRGKKLVKVRMSPLNVLKFLSTVWKTVSRTIAHAQFVFVFPG